MIRPRRASRGLALSFALLASASLAQPYPSKPVKVVVPFAPGGNLDITARIVADAMSRQSGQSFVVENRAGAGGLVGGEAVAKARPDGYTLLVSATGALTVSPLLVPTAPYRLGDFAPIGMMTVTPLLVEVPAGSAFGDFASFAGYVKSNPGKVSVGHSGNGTSNHMVILLLQQAMNAKFNIIAYKGSGPALNDLIGGQLDTCVDQIPSSLPHIKSGKIRPLAVSSKTRSQDLPEVPTLHELGLKDFEVVTTSGLFAPAVTPAEILATLNAALNKALADPAVRKRLSELGAEPKPIAAREFDQFLKAEDAKTQAMWKAGLLKGD
jgi:tripartite-type tricarboxylate transporter receptor subunit TctC